MAKERSKSISGRISKAVEVINYAIDNQVSVTEASIKSGFSRTYVKNIKAMVNQKFDNGELEVNIFNEFNVPYQRYLSKKEEWNNKPFTQTNKVVDKNKPKDIPSGGGRETLNMKDDNTADIEWVGKGHNYPNDHVKTLDELLNASQVDTSVWKVASHIINKWDVTSWKNGLAETVQNWQVKARLERDTTVVHEKQVGEIFRNMIEDYEPPIYTYETNINKGLTKDSDRHLLEISIFDLHIGKLAWAGETYENYDVKIARDRFLTSIETLLKHASGFNCERILFPVGNDFFNSDNMQNTTTKGTQQDEDLRWQKTFNVGVRLLVDAINMLKLTGLPVDVVVVPGNHDFERSYYMGSYLEAWFNADPDVDIDNHASPRKYYRYGNLLLGLTHGNEEKEAVLPMLMTTDEQSKPLWSETKYHEWHVGHIHRKRTVKYDVNKDRLLNEDLGITIRYLSSLSGTEEWHHKKGYVGSTKAADGFVWNFEAGLVAHLNSNLIIK